jgi:hypothetical protein
MGKPFPALQRQRLGTTPSFSSVLSSVSLSPPGRKSCRINTLYSFIKWGLPFLYQIFHFSKVSELAEYYTKLYWYLLTLKSIEDIPLAARNSRWMNVKNM